MAAIKALVESIENKNGKRAWEREVQALQKICRLRLPNVVEIAAMITIGKQPHFIFPWADGGSLLNLWKTRNSHHDRSEISRRLIPDIVSQLVGLAEALKSLHNLQHGNASSYRHGDLKPENILIFDSKNDSFPGVWKMADLGLARYHEAATGLRKDVTSNSGAGTISFQPPESFRPNAAPTSRLYDIWSMGCIILQLVTWLLYGASEINELTLKTKSSFVRNESAYWNSSSWSDKGGHVGIRVHTSVKEHITRMKRDVRGLKALQDLLSIIEDKLLVVELPKRPSVPEPGCRTNAEDLHRSLKAIQAACKDPKYWSSGRNIVKQASHLQIPQGQTLGIASGNKVSSNFLISSTR